jgi:hypothetical protein
VRVTPGNQRSFHERGFLPCLAKWHRAKAAQTKLAARSIVLNAGYPARLARLAHEKHQSIAIMVPPRFGHRGSNMRLCQLAHAASKVGG